MDTTRISLLILVIVIVSAFILVGISWANYRYSESSPGGNDFLSRWMGTRVFLLDGYSPYSDQATQKIQVAAYGRAARPSEDQMLFVYPFYTIALIAPFALIPDYAIARALWMTTLEISLVVSLLVMIRLVRWKIHIWLFSILVIFTLLWYHAVRPVINGNPSILVALFIVLTFLAIKKEMDALAGFLLALTTIKPQMVVLLILFVVLWAISQKRLSLIWSFLGSMTLLVISGIFLVPDWIVQNVRQVLSYPSYTLPGTSGAILTEWLPGVGAQLGWLLTIILTVILILEWRAAWKQDFKWFLWTACLTLVITNIIGFRTTTANYIAMYPALILIYSYWDKRWGQPGRILIFVIISILLFGLWWLFINTLIIGDQPIQHPIMFFPLPAFLFIGLYWVRWQAIRPQGPIFEQYRSNNYFGDK